MFRKERLGELYTLKISRGIHKFKICGGIKVDIQINRGRKISLENAKRIGGGATSDVYLIEEDTVVKVLKKCEFQEAEREILLSKWALKNGIPTAISYDVVDVDGYPGLVYESLGRGNLRNLLRDCPEDFESIMQRYVDLLHRINSIVVEEDSIPAAGDIYRQSLESIRGVLEDGEYFRMKALLNTVPEKRNLVHGDCQIKNVRVVKNEFLLIDLDTISYGDPIYELAVLYSCYQAYPEFLTGDYDPFFEMPVATESKILDRIFRLYFGDISDEEKQKNRKKAALLCCLYMASLELKGEVGSEGSERMLRDFRSFLPQVEDLKLTYGKPYV